MNWTILTSIITSLAAISTCGTLWSGFYLYRISKRDSEVFRLRNSLVRSRTLAQQLNRLLNYELGFEIGTSIVTSNQMQVFLRRVHRKFFMDLTIEKNKVVFNDYLKDNMINIFASVNSRMANSFEDKLIQLEAEKAIIQYDHPGVARILGAAVTVLLNTYNSQKTMMQNEEAWQAALVQLYDDSSLAPIIQDFDAFCNEFVEMFVGTWLQIMKEVNQANINDTLNSFNLVTERYLCKKPKELKRISKYEKRITLVSEDNTKTISEDLREAEKCLSRVLLSEELLMLRQYSSQIEARSHT